MPKLTPASTERRRDHIIAAAMSCFMKYGFAETTVDLVCAEGGISKGAFYSHFDSKQALIRGVLTVLQSEIRAPLTGDTVAQVVQSFFETRVAPAMGAAQSRFGLELMAASASEPDLRAAILHDLDSTRQAIEQAIARLAATGALRSNMDASAAAEVVEIFLLGTLMRNAVSPAKPGEALKALQTLFQSLLSA